MTARHWNELGIAAGVSLLCCIGLYAVLFYHLR